jgi:hypothetical protein
MPCFRILGLNPVTMHLLRTKDVQYIPRRPVTEIFATHLATYHTNLYKLEQLDSFIDSLTLGQNLGS